PFSLPRKIAQYTEEKARRAAQIDSANAEINAVLERIDAMTGGRHGLLARRLPVAVPAGKAGVDLIQRLVDDKTLEGLGDVLTQLGNEYKAKAGDVSLGGGDQSQVPSGTQPSPKLDDNQTIALLALETAKRLTPSTHQGPESSGAAYAVARFLYSDAVVDAARTNLEVRIPVAERFLQRAKDALQKAVADADTDAGYVRGGAAGGGDSVVDRKIALYQELNGITREGVEFYGLKVDWSKEGYKTVDRIGTYYDSTARIYESSGEVSEAEREAILKMKEALRKTFQELEDNRRKLAGWMSQLNSPQESALKRVAEDVRAIQEKTRAVLEQNTAFRDVEARHKRSHDIVKWTVGRLGEAQAALDKELRALKDPAALSPDLIARINQVRQGGGAWWFAPEGDGDAAALVVPKKDFSRFIDQIFAGVLRHEPSTRSLAALRSQLLENPYGLTQLIPGSQLVDFGD
ncbi:MAG: hypothetical protein AAB412_01030, partial [Elusimicrobiota bacterium]